MNKLYRTIKNFWDYKILGKKKRRAKTTYLIKGKKVTKKEFLKVYKKLERK